MPEEYLGQHLKVFYLKLIFFLEKNTLKTIYDQVKYFLLQPKYLYVFLEITLRQLECCPADDISSNESLISDMLNLLPNKIDILLNLLRRAPQFKAVIERSIKHSKGEIKKELLALDMLELNLLLDRNPEYMQTIISCADEEVIRYCFTQVINKDNFYSHWMLFFLRLNLVTRMSFGINSEISTSIARVYTVYIEQKNWTALANINHEFEKLSINKLIGVISNLPLDADTVIEYLLQLLLSNYKFYESSRITVIMKLLDRAPRFKKTIVQLIEPIKNEIKVELLNLDDQQLSDLLCSFPKCLQTGISCLADDEVINYCFDKVIEKIYYNSDWMVFFLKLKCVRSTHDKLKRILHDRMVDGNKRFLTQEIIPRHSIYRDLAGLSEDDLMTIISSLSLDADIIIKPLVRFLIKEEIYFPRWGYRGRLYAMFPGFIKEILAQLFYGGVSFIHCLYRDKHLRIFKLTESCDLNQFLIDKIKHTCPCELARLLRLPAFMQYINPAGAPGLTSTRSAVLKVFLDRLEPTLIQACSFMFSSGVNYDETRATLSFMVSYFLFVNVFED